MAGVCVWWGLHAWWGACMAGGMHGRGRVWQSQPAGLSGDTLEDVIHEGVHDGHSLARYTSVWVNLLEDLVDVDGVRFPPPPLPLLVSGTCSLCLAGSLLGSLGCSLWWHSVCTSDELNVCWL